MKGHIPKKRFGQNFLIDHYIIQKIVELINPRPQDLIVEIGPGLGALTKPMLEYVPHLDVVEIDRDIIAFLEKTLASKLTIHAVDALKFDFASISHDQIRIIGNLPYNISTPLLFHLSKCNNILDMHFMLQQEVVDRICAKPDSKDYGRLSVMLQYQFNCSKMLEVSHTCFNPQPKVESAIVKLTPKPAAEVAHIDTQKLNFIVTTAFNQRRKTIANSLKNVISPAQLELFAINPQKRPENLTVNEYISLSTLA